MTTQTTATFTPYGQAAPLRHVVPVVLAHVVVVALLLNLKPVAEALSLPQPLMVSLVSEAPPEVVDAPPKPLPVQVQPRVSSPAPPPPIQATSELAAPEQAPAQVSVPVPITPAPAPVPAPVLAAAAEPAQPQRAVPAMPAPAVVPPSFDADYLHNPAPVYPALSRRLGEQGQVVLRVRVNPEGGADQVEVRTSSGFERLDKAARDTVQRWRFVPARQGERGVTAWVLVPISFSLRS